MLGFRHFGTEVLSERDKLKNAKDLTKRRYEIFIDAIDFEKAYKNTDYVMVDINIRLKVFSKNGRSSFCDISDLKNLIVEENTE